MLVEDCSEMSSPAAKPLLTTSELITNFQIVLQTWCDGHDLSSGDYTDYCSESQPDSGTDTNRSTYTINGSDADTPSNCMDDRNVIEKSDHSDIIEDTHQHADECNLYVDGDVYDHSESNEFSTSRTVEQVNNMDNVNDDISTLMKEGEEVIKSTDGTAVEAVVCVHGHKSQDRDTHGSWSALSFVIHNGQCIEQKENEDITQTGKTTRSKHESIDVRKTQGKAGSVTENEVGYIAVLRGLELLGRHLDELNIAKRHVHVRVWCWNYAVSRQLALFDDQYHIQYEQIRRRQFYETLLFTPGCLPLHTIARAYASKFANIDFKDASILSWTEHDEEIHDTGNSNNVGSETDHEEESGRKALAAIRNYVEKLGYRALQSDSCVAGMHSGLEEGMENYQEDGAVEHCKLKLAQSFNVVRFEPSRMSLVRVSLLGTHTVASHDLHQVCNRKPVTDGSGSSTSHHTDMSHSADSALSGADKQYMIDLTFLQSVKHHKPLLHVRSAHPIHVALAKCPSQDPTQDENDSIMTVVGVVRVKVTVSWPMSRKSTNNMQELSGWVDALVVKRLPVPVHIATRPSGATDVGEQSKGRSRSRKKKKSRAAKKFGAFMPSNVEVQKYKKRKSFIFTNDSSDDDDTCDVDMDVVIPFKRNRLPFEWQDHKFWTGLEKW